MIIGTFLFLEFEEHISLVSIYNVLLLCNVFTAPMQPFFSLLSGLYNFYEASLACQAIGGQLAVVDNPETMDRVTNELYGM